MSFNRGSRNHKEPPSASGTLLLTFNPNNLPKWKKWYLVRAKAQFGTVGDALAAGKLPDFEATLLELAETGTYTARKPRPSDRRSTIFGFETLSDHGPAQVHPHPADTADFAHSDGESSLSGDESPAGSSIADRDAAVAQLGEMLEQASHHTATPSQASSQRSGRRKATHKLSKAEELILAGKIKRVQDAETRFMTDLPKLCGDIMQHIAPDAASRITQHVRFEAAWNANDAVDLMKIIEDCALAAPHDTERRIKDLKEAREKCYQYDRPLEVFCEEFEDFERQLVLLKRPTLESELILQFLDHLHPSYATTISLLRTADKIPATFEAVKALIKEHEGNARAQAKRMRSKPQTVHVQDTAMAATTHHPKKHNKGKPRKSETAAAVTDKSKQDSKTDLIKCVYCKKLGRHKAHECNQMKADQAKADRGGNHAVNASKTFTNVVTSKSGPGDDIILAVREFGNDDDSDSEVPSLWSDSSDSSDYEFTPRNVATASSITINAVDDEDVEDDGFFPMAPAEPTAEPVPQSPPESPPANDGDSDSVLPDLWSDSSDDESTAHNVAATRIVIPDCCTENNDPDVGAPLPPAAAAVVSTVEDVTAAVDHCYHAFPAQAAPAHRTVLCLDNACTTNVVKDKHLLRNLRRIPARTLHGLGQAKTDLGGTVDHFGFALYVPKCPFNLISFRQARESFNVQYDQESDTFVLTTLDTGVQFAFKLSADGLYTHTLDPPPVSALLSTDITVNGKSYTAQQVQRARAARELHCQLGHPSDNHLAHGLEHGAYLECPVTSNDVRLAQAILGKCPGCTIGKATEEPSPPSTSERASTPGEKLHMDIGFINTKPFLVTVDDCSGCIALSRLPNKNKSSVEKAILKIVAKYNSFGHKVRFIMCDREAVFSAAELAVNSNGIQLLRSGTGRHCKRAERAIRTLKAKFRATLLSLPYQLPPVLYMHLLDDIAQNCNLVPTTASGSRTPREIVTGVKLNMRTHMRTGFGDIIADKTPSQSNAAATDAQGAFGIAVGRDLSSKGDIKVFILNSGEFVTRHTFEQYRLTSEILAMINAHSEKAPALPTESSALLPHLSEDDILQPDIISVIEASVPADSDVTVTASSLESAELTSTEAHRGDIVHDIPTAQFVQGVSDPPSAAPPPADSSPDLLGADPPDEVPPPQQQRYELRPRRTNWREYGLHISIKAAQAQYPDAAEISMREELSQLLEQEVWEPVKKADLTPAQLKKIIPSSMFLKAKHKPDGSFDKLKSRLVAGGHRQDTTMYDNVSSPCVNLTSVFTLLSIAAYERRHIAAVDIKGAYLNARLSTVTVHMRIQQQLVTILKDLYRDLFKRDISEYICQDGSMIVHVLKALYGLIESALLWYKHLSTTLNRAGYTTSQNDRGVFFRTSKDKKCAIAIHVDDLLVTSTHKDLLDQLLKILTDTYKDINVQQDTKQLFYLGMQLDLRYDDGAIFVSQPGYIKDILAAHPVTRAAAYPATDDLFKCSTEGDPVEVTDYASRLMKLNYLTKRSRPDISLPVSFLATKMTKPDHFDDGKLKRVYEYLFGTQELGIILRPDSLTVHAWIDASYSVHIDYKSQTAIIVCIGETSGPVYVKSCKQKIMTDSSTFAELVALHDGVHVVESTVHLLRELDYHDCPAVVHQDNLSTMFLANRGPGIVSKSRHIPVRYYYVHDCIERGIITLVHCPTADMRVDYITKPKTGKTFRTQRDLSMGNINA